MIKDVNGEKVKEKSEMERKVENIENGEKEEMKVWRKKKEEEIKVKIDEMKNEKGKRGRK